MKWPRGRHNGMKIKGVEVQLLMDLTWWVWIPNFGWKYSRGFNWMCFHLWLHLRYDPFTDLK